MINITRNQNGQLWIGTTYGVNRYNPVTGQFTRYLYNPDDPYSLSNEVILTYYQITEDNQGNIWIATEYGLNKFDPDIDGFVHYFYQAKQNSISDNKLWGIMAELYRWTGLAWNDISSLYQDSNGILLLYLPVCLPAILKKHLQQA